jgi:hypothetical protein
MKNIGICLLSIGEEHIIESINLIKTIQEKIVGNYKFYVGTDQPEKFIDYEVNTILIEEEFNYNFKNIPISRCFDDCDISVFLDSDHILLEKLDLKDLENVQDGFYGSIYKDYINPNYVEYHETIAKMNKSQIPYIFEHMFIIKLSEERKKKAFIENWNHVFNITKNIQPISKSKMGANEGLIISLSCLMSEIKILDAYYDSNMVHYFKGFYHYRD